MAGRAAVAAAAAIGVAALFGGRPAAAAERLIFTSMSPAGSLNSKLFRAWAAKVDADSKGTLQIDVRDGGTLANYINVYDRVRSNVVQIGWAIHQLLGGRFPRTVVAGLPFQAENSELGSVALWRLYKSGVLGAEYQDVVPLWFVVTPQSAMHFSDKPPTLANLRGIKVAVLGRDPAMLVEGLGGTPISVQTQDFYETLQRGTVGAGMISFAAFPTFKLEEVTKYHVAGTFGASTMMFFMAKSKFDSLPAAAQHALLADGGEAESRAFGRYLDGQDQEVVKSLKASPKHTVATLSPAEMANWHKAAEPVIKAWEKKAPDGAAILAKFQSIYAGVKAGH
jgi:TRAP-type C4-dicarboxylate transport system substrate-binding protein